MTFNKGDVLPPQFRLDSQLGVGGFSEVWRATDLQARDEVAIKIFLKQDQDGVDLCREEYRRMNYLRHPNILQPRYFGHFEGAPFIVMPFCELGSTMSRLGHYNEKQLASLIAQVGSALGHIHTMAQPIIHNDIKPDNILEERAGHFVLADFGISERLSRKLLQSVPDDTQKTQMLNADRKSGMAPMAYRAPELFNFAGRTRQSPTTAADVWALGATLYQIATGNLPFDTEGGLRQLTYHNANNAVKINDIVTALPRDRFAFELDAMIKSCLALNPEDRPDANFLADAARKFLNTGAWPALAPAAPVGAIRLSQDAIQFGEIPIGKTGMQAIHFQAEGIQGNVHVTATPPFVIALPGQPLRSSLDVPVSGNADTHTVEVHFEPDNTTPAEGELYFSNPTAGQERARLSGRGKKESGGAFPWWMIAGLAGVVAMAAVVFFLLQKKKDKPSVVVEPTPIEHRDSNIVQPTDNNTQPGPDQTKKGPSQSAISDLNGKTTKAPNPIGAIIPTLSVVSTAKVDRPVTFSDNTKIKKGQQVLKKRWDFGDGNVSSDMGASVSHVYRDPGDYKVQLCINDTVCSVAAQLKVIEDESAYTPTNFVGGQKQTIGAPTEARCGSSEAEKQWSSGGNITLRPSRNVQLKSARIYADHPGRVTIVVKDVKKSDYSETFTKNVAQGSNEFSFLEDFTLIGGRSYTMTVSTQVKGYNIAPKLENVAPCNPTLATSSVLGLEYNGNIILFNLTFEY